jgi:hypothetical protein
VNWYNNRFLPQIRQFFLIPNRSGAQIVIFHLLLEPILPEFDHYLTIYTFSTLQQQFQPQDDWDQVLRVLSA